MSSRLRVLLSGGGTTGHIAPALAVAAELRRLDPEVQLLYIGARDGLESELVPRANIEFAGIEVSAIFGRRALGAARSVTRAVHAVSVSRDLARKFAPDVALGTGGYVAGPVLLAAWLSGVPTAIHEQNLRPGFTNRMLSRVVSEIYVSFAGSLRYFPRRAVVTGYPVRPEILAAERATAAAALGLDPGRPTVLVAAGSRGARTISEAVKAGVPQLIKELPRLQLIISTGQEYYDDVRSSLAAAVVSDELSERVRIYPYIHRMDHAYACADLVLSRAGGSTHELLARGLPAILVPSPNVAYDQQRDNALSLTAIGAALMIEDRELTGKRFAGELCELLSSPERLSAMAAKSAAAGRRDGGAAIASRLAKLAGTRRPVSARA